MAAASFLSSRLNCPKVRSFLNPQFRRISIRSISDSESNENMQSLAGKRISVPVQVAYELLRAGHVYLDVRTPDEFSAGHPCGAMNIPYMFRDGTGISSKNSRFLEKVSSQFRESDEILIGCQTGRRSLMAAADLQSAGFSRVIDVSGGYAAWAESGFPTKK